MRSNLGGGDCRVPLQVGGAGEGNLPRKSLIVFTETETASFLRNILQNGGEFIENGNETIWKKTLLEQARPFCPWAITKRHSSRKKSSFRQSDIHDIRNQSKLAFKVTKPKPPSWVVVPRLVDLKNLQNVVNCWRDGVYENAALRTSRRIEPLYTLCTAKKRKELWPGSSDTWWKDSGNKCAYARIRRIVQKVASFANNLDTIYERGEDETWNIALTRCAEEVKSKPLTSV